jgi:hypothetical protein
MPQPQPHLDRIRSELRLEAAAANWNSAAELRDGAQPDSSCDSRVRARERFRFPHDIPQAARGMQPQYVGLAPPEEPQTLQ